MLAETFTIWPKTQPSPPNSNSTVDIINSKLSNATFSLFGDPALFHLTTII